MRDAIKKDYAAYRIRETEKTQDPTTAGISPDSNPFINVAV